MRETEKLANCCQQDGVSGSCSNSHVRLVTDGFDGRLRITNSRMQLADHPGTDPHPNFNSFQRLIGQEGRSAKTMLRERLSFQEDGDPQ